MSRQKRKGHVKKSVCGCGTCPVLHSMSKVFSALQRYKLCEQCVCGSSSGSPNDPHPSIPCATQLAGLCKESTEHAEKVPFDGCR